MKPDDVKINFRKPNYEVSDELFRYLEKYGRTTQTRVLYDDLLRFSGYISLEDEQGNDTLWLRVYYPEFERAEIEASLNKIYTLLHSDGDEETLPFLTVDSIDYCTFGNSKPFRIKVRNILNDNFTNFYIKKADASRIYGLELEEILSPNRINFLIHKDTLIEEHIIGVPGDVFIQKMLPNCTELEKAQIAKEFVKFNERCFLGLLGDMRSYNYVVIPIHDFDHVVYRIRPIDFDQQSYEGNLKIYFPQFYKENFQMVKLVMDKLKPNSVEQYRKEVRSATVKRILGLENRLEELLAIMRKEEIAPKEHVEMLKKALQKYTHDIHFKQCNTMGDIVSTGIELLLKNYKNYF
ncbi:hypothetical protein NHF50_04430 [Flavobacterium sp. NRK F10]|uniref:hypothetical protein n=1 Tax=Flavobacterium sp. NRK F10 TaxID=2954931 RepID=UPI0020916FEB|nr:hypothetical protein [Flavobacterium sp. NRK F10]MCO6174284.1 hypothetical protein [Flavobacterium sp. NRK F10]